mmetsp:Transcript_36221/g.55621  ORF Transcript_36221/g.55621 Transcript_36221/m.55621 type:complete len:164 (+) Transcript_36221:637-1128(+)
MKNKEYFLRRLKEIAKTHTDLFNHQKALQQKQQVLRNICNNPIRPPLCFNGEGFSPIFIQNLELLDDLLEADHNKRQGTPLPAGCQVDPAQVPDLFIFMGIDLTSNSRMKNLTQEHHSFFTDLLLPKIDHIPKIFINADVNYSNLNKATCLNLQSQDINIIIR